MQQAERLDADFAAYPNAEKLLQIAGRTSVRPLQEVTLRVASGHTPYLHDVDLGDVGFVTVECVGPLRFHTDKLKRVTQSQYEREFSSLRIEKGTVLCTIKRRICQAYPWIDEPVVPLALNQDVALLVPKEGVRAAYLAAYLSSRVGQAFAERQKTEQMNPYISLANLRTLPVYVAGDDLQDDIEAVVGHSQSAWSDVQANQRQAQEALIEALGLATWSPPDPLTYSASAAEVRHARRLDAQFFAPRFEGLIAHVEDTGQAVRFGDILSMNARGNQPTYSDAGLPVVNSRHVRINRVEIEGARTADPALAGVLIEEGDLLLNGTGVGTIGRAAPYLRQDKAIPDNHVTVLRADGIDPIYLSVFLNSRIGQMQVERHLKGSSGQIELYPTDIDEFVIWRAPDQVQQEIRDFVLESFEAERRAIHLCDVAKHAVEIAVEKGDVAARQFLNEVEG
ncbi:hypothetical protein AAFN88_16900 [Pelagibius sp. CAU 1746]|uniref:hypothetical protein n=1 Tax=Pelagibius sp. CAU 1746 TaxID=3140370 RepID=UPI00325B1186